MAEEKGKKSAKSTAGVKKTAAKSSLPQTKTSKTPDELKARFKSGSIPLESDFADLIDLTVPVGAIIMWSGSTLPAGWALCDGANGTPDLVDRFILGGTAANVGGANSASVSGSGNGVTYIKTTSSEDLSVVVKIDETLLTEKQLPGHQHLSGVAWRSTKGMKFGSEYFDPDTVLAIQNFDENTGHEGHLFLSDKDVKRDLFEHTDKDAYHAYTEKTGDGKGHTHTGSATADPHSHTTDIIPPYYILAFIMKL